MTGPSKTDKKTHRTKLPLLRISSLTCFLCALVFFFQVAEAGYFGYQSKWGQTVTTWLTDGVENPIPGSYETVHVPAGGYYNRSVNFHDVGHEFHKDYGIIDPGGTGSCDIGCGLRRPGGFEFVHLDTMFSQLVDSVPSFPALIHSDSGNHLFYVVDVLAYSQLGGSFTFIPDSIQEFHFQGGSCAELPGYKAAICQCEADVEDVFDFTYEQGWVISDTLPGVSLYTGNAIVAGALSLRPSSRIHIPTLTERGAIIFGALLMVSVAFYIWRRRRVATA